MNAFLRARGVGLHFPIHGSRAELATPSAGDPAEEGDYLGGVRLDVGGRQVIRALQDVSFSLERGGRLGVIGHNGSGKSTLLRVLAGLYHPHEGSIERSGEVSAIFNMSIGFRQEASGLRNIVIKGLMAGRTRREIQRVIPEIADFTGLHDYLDLPLHTYSQGMALRLAFAITTAFHHDILVMDEWIGAGDAAFQEKVVARMNGLLEAANICVIASHNNALLRRVTEQCLWLEQGRVRALGPTGELLDAYESEVRERRRRLQQARRAREPIPADHRAIWLEYAPAQVAQPQLCWDVADFGIDRVRIDVRVNPDDPSSERLVATGPGTGERAGGAWLRPGMVFVLRDAEDGTLLGETVVPDRQA